EGGLAHWSPDGTRMALTRKEQGWMRLFGANADGSGLSQLTKTEGVFECVWSADGQRIYFTHNSRSILQFGMSVISTAGGAVQEVLPLSEAVYNPAMSPDGKTLAYVKGTDFSAGVVIPPKAIKILDLATRQ